MVWMFHLSPRPNVRGVNIGPNQKKYQASTHAGSSPGRPDRGWMRVGSSVLIGALQGWLFRKTLSWLADSCRTRSSV